MQPNPLEYVRVTYPEPHLERMRKILSTYPEVKKLFGPNPWTFFFVLGLVGAQILLSLWMPSLPWWAVLVLGYTVGAVANHALWVLIHECTHNLVFKKSAANSWLQIFANLPIVFPSAMSFRIFHIKHHLFQGDPERDADLPRPFEAAWVRDSSFRKSLWFMFFFVSQVVRVPYLKSIQGLTRWVLINWMVEVGFLCALGVLAGPKALAYLGVASMFSIGLHPLGARWIQEHYVVHEKQETYSYYGPLNRVAFNVGFHNEHHDFMNVAWTRLPTLRATAPEYYDTLYWHSSWSRLMWRFLTDPGLSLYSRVIRERTEQKSAAPGLAVASQAAVRAESEVV